MYLIFIHCKFKFEKHKQIFLSENYEQIFPNKKKHMKSTNNLSLVKTIIEHDMGTRVLRRPIVFLRIHCGIVRLACPTLLS